MSVLLRNLLSLALAFETMVCGLSGEVPDSVHTLCNVSAYEQIEATAQKPGTIRVASYNILCKSDADEQKRDHRRSMVVKTIEQILPDSFGVQEATPEWMEYLEEAMPLYDSVGEGRDGGNQGEHSAIFYLKYQYKLLDSGTFWLSQTPDTPSKGWDAALNRICTWAVLKNRLTGKVYAHVNSHFDHKGATAIKEETKMILNFIRTEPALKDIPVVVTMDMNAESTSTPYKTMTSVLTDSAVAAPDSNGYYTYHAFDPIASSKRKVIDYVFCNDGFQATVYRTVTKSIDGCLASDHFPVYADFILKK